MYIAAVLFKGQVLSPAFFAEAAQQAHPWQMCSSRCALTALCSSLAACTATAAASASAGLMVLLLQQPRGIYRS